MLSRPSDSQHVEQLEIIEAQHIHQSGWTPIAFWQFKPPIELRLRLADRSFDTGDAIGHEGHIISFSHECDLVLQVGKTVIDRCRRQHQNFGFHPGLDDPLHEMVVAAIAVLMRRLSSGNYATRR